MTRKNLKRRTYDFRNVLHEKINGCNEHATRLFFNFWQVCKHNKINKKSLIPI
jgi:hypothetical protein